MSDSVCVICGADFRDCDHSVSDVRNAASNDAMEAAIDRRLVELGVVEKTHTKIIQSAKQRARRARRLRG